MAVQPAKFCWSTTLWPMCLRTGKKGLARDACCIGEGWNSENQRYIWLRLQSIILSWTSSPLWLYATVSFMYLVAISGNVT